jgi:5'-3' exonuclease
MHFHPEDNEKFYMWRHQMMNDIIDKIKLFSSTKVILVFDEKGSWRYDVYDRYKESRKAFKENSVVDFEKFYPVFNGFRDDIKEFFSNIYVISGSKCEGDDIIAVLVRQIFAKNGDEVTIISSDRDMNQLLSLNNVKQYDPIKGQYLESINPKLQLQLKILTGDRSDSIPAIKKRFGIVSAEKLIKEGVDEFLNKPENEEAKNNYERNKILIDFDFIPEYIQETILNMYRNYQIKPIDATKVRSFFTKNRLAQLMSRWGYYSDMIKSLK